MVVKSVVCRVFASREIHLKQRHLFGAFMYCRAMCSNAMSQAQPTNDADAPTETTSAAETNDTGRDVDEMLAKATDTLENVAEDLGGLEANHVSDAESESLADLRNTLRDVEKAAENARKDAAEEELSNRVEPGEKIAGLSFIETEKWSVPDEEAVVEMVRDAGRMPETVMEVDAGALEEVAKETEGVSTEPLGTYSYTYFR